MYIGHFAVAFRAKRIAPSVSLGTPILAAQFADLVWPTRVLLGIETLQIRPGMTAVTPLTWAVAIACAYLFALDVGRYG